ncbi:MAG TPA: SH3-like domain-containing protein [Streptosporangiaceae bacterium]
MRFAPGDRVRARVIDPDHHIRLPRYVRGQVGEVVESEGEWELPDDKARGVEPARVETVYAVRFPAASLWGEGAHTVTVDLWESYLEEAT